MWKIRVKKLKILFKLLKKKKKKELRPVVHFGGVAGDIEAIGLDEPIA